jgi:ankyrin repeat protein
VRALIAAGANVNAKNKHGDRALMLASQNHHMDVVQLLKDAGAKK